MMKCNLVLAACVLLSASVLPAVSISRWFTSSYYDLQYTMRRYGHCVSDLPPLKAYNVSETDYLINQVREFLDQANYDNEQMANISALMDKFCVHDLPDGNYPISQAIDIDKYNNKLDRCQSINDAMDAMFQVLKRGALNRSEPLDFSSILWYPQSNDTKVSYSLADLVNTSWIKAGVTLEDTCRITDSVKEYVEMRKNKYTVQDRNQQQVSTFRGIIEYLNSILNELLGAQKRMLLVTSSRLEMLQQTIGHQLDNLRDGLGKGYQATRKRVSDLVVSRSSPLNSTVSSQLNGTHAPAQVNATSKVFSTVTATTVSSATTTPSAKVSQFAATTPSVATVPTTMAPRVTFPSTNNNNNNLNNFTNY